MRATLTCIKSLGQPKLALLVPVPEFDFLTLVRVVEDVHIAFRRGLREDAAAI